MDIENAEELAIILAMVSAEITWKKTRKTMDEIF